MTGVLGLENFSELAAGFVPRTESLSRGEKARIALLMAVAGDSPLLLLDDWDVWQSPDIRVRFYSSILPRLLDSGRTVVVATSDERRCDAGQSVIRLNDGRTA